MALDRPDIVALIDGYLDGGLDAEGLEALSAWLTSSRRHRDLFARAVMADRAARDLAESRVQLDRIREPLPGLEQSRQIDDEVWQGLLDDALAARRRAEVEHEAGLLLGKGQAEQRRLRLAVQPEPAAPAPRVIVIPRVVVYGGVLAAVLTLVGLIYLNQPAPPAKPTGHAVSPPDPITTPQPTAATVAHLRDSAGAVWIDGPRDGTVRAGDELALHRGLARLTMMDGTSVVVEGPARLRAVSGNALYLYEGQLTARSPSGEDGFHVDTAVGRVTDLGTEFGVVLDPMGRLQAHVFDGAVTVAAAGGEALAGPAHRLVVGQAAAVNPDGAIQTAEADVVAFVRQEEFEARRDADTSPAARWLAHRYAVRRMAGLVAYYPMGEDSMQAGRVLNAAPATGAALDGRLGDPRYQAAAPAWVPGRVEGKQALAFDGARRLVVIDDHDSLDDLPAITVAAWVRPDYDRVPGLGAVSILGKRESLDGRLTFQLHLLTPTYNGVAAGPLSIQFATGTQANSDDPAVSTHRHAEGVLPPSGEWVHVVAMGDAERTRFYVNGVFVGEAGGLLSAGNDAPLFLGGTDTTQGDGAGGRAIQGFAGLIDEVMIFDRLLTEAEVRRLHAGTP